MKSLDLAFKACKNCHCHWAVDVYLTFGVRILARDGHKGFSLSHNSHNVQIFLHAYCTIYETGKSTTGKDFYEAVEF